VSITIKLEVEIKNLKDFNILNAHILHIEHVDVGHQLPLTLWEVIGKHPNIDEIVHLNSYDGELNIIGYLIEVKIRFQEFMLSQDVAFQLFLVRDDVEFLNKVPYHSELLIIAINELLVNFILVKIVLLEVVRNSLSKAFPFNLVNVGRLLVQRVFVQRRLQFIRVIDKRDLIDVPFIEGDLLNDLRAPLVDLVGSKDQ
jgi:hypothetical protein